jgi:hypothetical protein
MRREKLRENIDVLAEIGNVITEAKDMVGMLKEELQDVKSFQMGSQRTASLIKVSDSVAKQLNVTLSSIRELTTIEKQLAERLIALYSIEVNRRVSTVIRKILEHQDMDKEKVYEIEDEILKELSSADAYDEKPA